MRRALFAGMLALLAFAAPAAAYETAALPASGTLRGIVRLAGKPPRPGPIEVAKDRHVCQGHQAREFLVLGADRALRDTVVLVEGIARGKTASAEPLTLDVRDCQFVPRVLAMTVGQRLRVRNVDPIVHNPQGRLGAIPVFNVALPGRGQVVDVTRRLTQPGVVRLRCGVHRETSGWIVVHDSPYFAVSDDAGAFEIRDIPPGTYRVTAWHEPFGSRPARREEGRVRDGTKRVTKRVSIVGDGTATLELELR